MEDDKKSAINVVKSQKKQDVVEVSVMNLRCAEDRKEAASHEIG